MHWSALSSPTSHVLTQGSGTASIVGQRLGLKKISILLTPYTLNKSERGGTNPTKKQLSQLALTTTLTKERRKKESEFKPTYPTNLSYTQNRRKAPEREHTCCTENNPTSRHQKCYRPEPGRPLLLGISRLVGPGHNGNMMCSHACSPTHPHS